MKIGKMEQGHAVVWNGIAIKSHGLSFKVPLPLWIKILLAKLFSLILPFTIFIHYMEYHERNAILWYNLDSLRGIEQTPR